MLKYCVKFSYSAQKLPFQIIFFPTRLCVTEKRTHVNRFIFPIFKQFCFQYPLINSLSLEIPSSVKADDKAVISFEDDFEEKSAINPNWKNYEKNNSAEIQPVNQLEKTKQVRVYHSSSDEDEEKGQAHDMF